MRAWLRNSGFPLLVFADLLGSAYLAASVRVPEPLPEYALQAEPVYRLEVGAACFIAAYLAALAFFLALEGRGFTEIGTRGLRATDVVRAADEQEASLSEQMKLIRSMVKNLSAVETAMRRADARLNQEAQKRVSKQEKST